MKINSGGGYNSNKTTHSRSGKQEPISNKGNPAGVAQVGLSHAFRTGTHDFWQGLSALRS